MKLVTHDRATKVKRMNLNGQTMTVWLTNRIELTIERGDTVKKVVKAVLPIYKQLPSRPLIRELVSYWFDIGESGSGKFKRKAVSLTRKYTPGPKR